MKTRAGQAGIPGDAPKRWMAWLRRGLEALFIALCCAYWAYRALKVTTLGVSWPKGFDRTLLILTAVAAAARLALAGPKRRETWIGAAIAAVYAMVYRADGYRFLLILAAQTVGMIGIDYRKVLKAYLAVVGCVLLASAFAALTGVIPNIVYFRDGLRSSWGQAYPTDFSSAFLFAMVALWVAWRGAPDWALLPLGAAPALLALWITRSRNSLVCSLVFLCAIGYCWLEAAVLDRRRGLRWIPRTVDVLTTASFPLFAAVMLAMVCVYARGSALGLRLNDVLSDRLRLSLESYRAHGITPFGTPFAQAGYGGSAFPPLNYSFLDSSYALILLRYGWATLLMLAATWCWTVRRAIRAGDRRLALALALIAFHSIVEHHFTEPHFNVLLVMPLASFAPRAAQADGGARGRTLAGVAVAALLLAGGLLLPRLLTRMRTAFAALGWQGKGPSALPVSVVGLLTAGLVAGAAWGLYRILRAALERRRPQARALAALLGCVALGAAGWIWTGGVVARAVDANAAQLEADAPGLETVLAAAENRVYVDALPEVYMRRFGGISDTALPGEDLARHAGATVVLDASKDHRVFFQSGFRYARISNRRGVYTGDPAVIAALEAAGYPVTDYFATLKQISLESVARLNKLTLDERGLLLDGKKHSIKSAPYRDLYAGRYEVIYRLALTEEALRQRAAATEDAQVCTLRVNAYQGEQPVTELPVYASQFDEAGALDVALTFDTAGVRDARFLAIAENGWTLYVTGLSYRQVPY